MKKKPEIRLHRFWQDDKQTSGACTVLNLEGFPVFSSSSLERGWRNNKPSVSCLPIGEYDVVLEWSPAFKQMLWEIKGTEPRTECKFHLANYWFQLKGCISLGLRYLYLNKDKYRDLTNSKNTMRAFHASLKGFTEAKLIITGEKGIF